jgi:hypothetical protein
MMWLSVISQPALLYFNFRGVAKFIVALCVVVPKLYPITNVQITKITVVIFNLGLSVYPEGHVSDGQCQCLGVKLENLYALEF